MTLAEGSAPANKTAGDEAVTRLGRSRPFGTPYVPGWVKLYRQHLRGLGLNPMAAFALSLWHDRRQYGKFLDVQSLALAADCHPDTARRALDAVRHLIDEDGNLLDPPGSHDAWFKVFTSEIKEVSLYGAIVIAAARSFPHLKKNLALQPNYKAGDKFRGPATEIAQITGFHEKTVRKYLELWSTGSHRIAANKPLKKHYAERIEIIVKPGDAYILRFLTVKEREDRKNQRDAAKHRAKVIKAPKVEGAVTSPAAEAARAEHSKAVDEEVIAGFDGRWLKRHQAVSALIKYVAHTLHGLS